jgi:hypothetical protein
MRGAIPLLPQYAFTEWCSVKAQGQLYPYYYYHHHHHHHHHSHEIRSINDPFRPYEYIRLVVSLMVVHVLLSR